MILVAARAEYCFSATARLSKWTVFPFDQPAAAKFDGLRAQKLGLKTMDLKIAAIVLIRNGKLLSANRRDFQRVPALIVEDWLHD